MNLESNNSTPIIPKTTINIACRTLDLKNENITYPLRSLARLYFLVHQHQTKRERDWQCTFLLYQTAETT